MSFIRWDTPIKNASDRSIELRDLRFDRNSLAIVLATESEDMEESIWSLSFDSTVAFQMTTEECSGLIIQRLPSNGGNFFQSKNSDWINSLGGGEVDFLTSKSHLAICCYDEIIEIIANIETARFSQVELPK